jgi:hypothetical protein
LAEQYGFIDEFEDKFQDARSFVNIFEPFFSPSLLEETMSEEQFASSQKDLVTLLEKRSLKSREMTDIIDIRKENFVQDSDPNLPHNLSPGVLKGSKNPLGMVQATFQKHLNKSYRSSDYQQKIVRTLWKIFTTIQKLDHAEDASDENAIFHYLTELQQLAEDEQHGEFVDKDGVQRRREWNTSRLIAERASDIKAIFGTGKIDERQKLLERCENIVTLSGDTRSQLREKVNTLAVVTEALHLATLATPALDAVDAGDNETAVSLLKDIMSLVQKGTFSRGLAENSDCRDTLSTVQAAYYRSSVTLAFGEFRWAESLQLFSEWRSNEESWTTLMESERCEAMLRMEASCRILANMQHFFGALEELDMLRAASLLGDFTASFDAEATTNPVAARAALDLCGQTFIDVFQYLVTDGPEAARDYCSRCLAILRELDVSLIR